VLKHNYLYIAMEYWFPTIPTLTTIWRLC